MRKVRIYIIYFPILLVSFQVIANLFGFLLPEYYSFLVFYLNTFLGTNVLFSIFLLLVTAYDQSEKLQKFLPNTPVDVFVSGIEPDQHEVLRIVAWYSGIWPNPERVITKK